MGVQRASVTNALQAFPARTHQLRALQFGHPDSGRIPHRDPHRAPAQGALRFPQRVPEDSPRTGLRAACKLEHDMGDESLDTLIKFARFITTCPRTGKDWLEAFTRSCGERGACTNCTDCIRSCLGARKENAPRMNRPRS